MSQTHSTYVEPGTMKLERLLPGPVERVWAYLVEGDKRALWLAGGTFDLRVGGKVKLEFDHARLSSDKVPPAKYKDMGKPQFEGVITRLEPNRLLAYTWPFKSEQSEVTFELEPRGKDTLLRITHRRLHTDVQVGVMSGWDVHTGILEDVLRGNEPRPFWTTHEKLEREYRSVVPA